MSQSNFHKTTIIFNCLYLFKMMGHYCYNAAQFNNFLLSLHTSRQVQNWITPDKQSISLFYIDESLYTTIVTIYSY